VKQINFGGDDVESTNEETNIIIYNSCGVTVKKTITSISTQRATLVMQGRTTSVTLKQKSYYYHKVR